MIIVARYFSVNVFGKFSYMVAIVSILSKIVDFGLVPIVFREGSKSETNLVLLNSALTLRIIFFLIVIIITNIIMFLSSFLLQEVVLINILFFSIIISSRMENFRELFSIPYNIQLRMHIPAVINVIDNIIFLILVLIMPLINGGIYYLVLSYVFSNIPGFIAILLFLRYDIQLKLRFSLNKTGWLFKQSLPLAGFVIIIVMYHQFDLLLLTFLKGDYEAGIFSTAMRLIMPLNILPVAVSATVFPIIMRNLMNEDKRDKIISITQKFLFISAFTIILQVVFKSKEIVILIFGTKYENAHEVLSILIISQLFLFLNFFSINLFTASNKQHWNFLYGFIIFIISIISSIILIPTYSYVGPAIAKVLSSFFGTVFLIYYLKSLNYPSFPLNFRVALWMLSLVAVAYFTSFLDFYIHFVLLNLILFILAYLLRVFNNDELNIIFSLIQREKWAKTIDG